MAKSKRPEPHLFGFLNINKPSGKTAHDVVAAVRRIIKIKQVGHGGTLDPMAKGVLPIAVGKATRLLRFLEGRKVYLAKIQFGLQTTTDDIEGEAVSTSTSLPSREQVVAELSKWVGPLKQIPPAFSAVHIDGKRLYELARAGQVPADIPARDVIVYSIELIDYQPPFATARIACGAGTYIRSIARDAGAALGCGGCLAGLTREAAGPFQLENALTLEALQQAAESGTLEQLLTPPERSLLLDAIEVSDEESFRLRRGQAIGCAEISTAEVHQAQEHVLAMCNGTIVAVCRRANATDAALAKIQPEVVLANAE